MHFSRFDDPFEILIGTDEQTNCAIELTYPTRTKRDADGDSVDYNYSARSRKLDTSKTYT